MGHRALVAYERTDSTYNLHYSHWGAAHLKLKHRITKNRPYGGDVASDWFETVHERLTDGADPDAVDAEFDIYGDSAIDTDVDILPQATGVTFEDILTDHLDYLSHEAFYVVDRDFTVTAYTTLWFGLQYDSDRIEEQPTIGYGAIQTVRWFEREPVNEGYITGRFEGMKQIVGQMVDRGVFNERQAESFLKARLAAVTDSGYELHFGAVA